MYLDFFPDYSESTRFRGFYPSRFELEGFTTQKTIKDAVNTLAIRLLLCLIALKPHATLRAASWQPSLFSVVLPITYPYPLCNITLTQKLILKHNAKLLDKKMMSTIHNLSYTQQRKNR